MKKAFAEKSYIFDVFFCCCSFHFIPCLSLNVKGKFWCINLVLLCMHTFLCIEWYPYSIRWFIHTYIRVYISQKRNFCKEWIVIVTRKISLRKCFIFSNICIKWRKIRVFDKLEKNTHNARCSKMIERRETNKSKNHRSAATYNKLSTSLTILRYFFT